MSMREVGTCRNDPVAMTDLRRTATAPDTCREEATGCEVPGCACAGGCSTSAPATATPPRGLGMSEPVVVGDAAPGELVDRASHGYDRVGGAGRGHRLLRSPGAAAGPC